MNSNFRFLFHVIMLHTCFGLHGLLQEINNVSGRQKGPRSPKRVEHKVT